MVRFCYVLMHQPGPGHWQRRWARTSGGGVGGWYPLSPSVSLRPSVAPLLGAWPCPPATCRPCSRTQTLPSTQSLEEGEGEENEKQNKTKKRRNHHRTQKRLRIPKKKREEELQTREREREKRNRWMCECCWFGVSPGILASLSGIHNLFCVGLWYVGPVEQDASLLLQK